MPKDSRTTTAHRHSHVTAAIIIALMALFMLLATACSSTSDSAPQAMNDSTGASGPPSLSESAGSRMIPESSSREMTAGSSTMEGPMSDRPPPEPAPSLADREMTQQTAIKAGQTDDNELWDKYAQYVNTYEGDPVDTTKLCPRYTITVLDPQGNPVHAAQVKLQIGSRSHTTTAITHTDGRTMFFPTKELEGAIRMQATQPIPELNQDK